MSDTARLKQILAFIKERGWKYTYTNEDECGSIDFEYRGVPYHIWEFHEDVWGVETNIRHGGRMEEIFGDYEAEILDVMKDWH